MLIYELKVQFSLVQLGDAEPLNKPEKVVAYLKDAFAEYPMQEQFFVICLDRKNRGIGRTRLSLGSLTATIVDLRSIWQPAILSSASAIIVAHNHPSGDPAPSSADISITRRIRESAQIMAIDFLDHVIVGHPAADPLTVGYYSFREAGLV